MTHTLRIDYDDSVLLETSLPREDFEKEAALLLAAKLYELGRLSSGKAARLLGMGRIDFIKATGKMGIPSIHMSPEEFATEVAVAKTL